MATLYRVENPDTQIGMWYNQFGEKTDFVVKHIVNAQCKDVPMDFDPQMKDGGDWISACDNLPDMSNWFSASDLAQFQHAGYGLFRIEVPNYRMANGHAIFLREQAIEIVEVPIDLLEIKE